MTTSRFGQSFFKRSLAVLSTPFMVSLCVLSIVPNMPAIGNLSTKQVRELIRHAAGMELKRGAVRIKRISPIDSSTVETAAQIETAIRLEKNDSGQWRVAEIRSGQGRWEDIGLIAHALNTELDAMACDNPELALAPSDPSVKRARCLVANLAGIQLPSDAVRIRKVSSIDLPLGSKPSALITAIIDADFRLTRVEKGSWRVSGIRTGNREWVNPEAVLRKINAGKAAVVRVEIGAIVRALENFRRDRGFYVVSDSQAVLIDYLSPRYLVRVIRLDPWQNAYRYTGTRDSFTLRSIGPDGKENTDDDIVLTGPLSSAAPVTPNE